jgi:hypothetical protein
MLTIENDNFYWVQIKSIAESITIWLCGQCADKQGNQNPVKNRHISITVCLF